MTLEELQERIQKIKALLDDPQPGLFTWSWMLGKQMTEISELWMGDKYDPRG